MGVTGYTYDGQFKGAFISFGDYRQGGRFTIAHGRATDINYNYTGPMMRGVGVKSSEVADLVSKVAYGTAYQGSYAQALKDGKSETAAAAAANTYATGVKNTYYKQTYAGLTSDNAQERAATAGKILNQVKGQAGDLSALASNLVVTADKNTAFTYYPMKGDGVEMGWGDDEDVPVTYASYIFKKPKQWEFHAYAMKANGPVGKICKAYGFAGAYYVTPMWHVQGEFVKNMRKLPLNNERPYSFNYGLHYGTADILQARSFEVGLDYVYSQAGTYFGGSSDDIVDQYMGHVYKNWRGRRNVPAYFADKIDAMLDSDPSNDNSNYGGAKFFLAKA